MKELANKNGGALFQIPGKDSESLKLTRFRSNLPKNMSICNFYNKLHSGSEFASIHLKKIGFPLIITFAIFYSFTTTINASLVPICRYWHHTQNRLSHFSVLICKHALALDSFKVHYGDIASQYFDHKLIFYDSVWILFACIISLT